MRNFVIGLILAMIGAGLAFVVSSAGIIGLDMEKTALVAGIAGVLVKFVAAFGDDFLPKE